MRKLKLKIKNICEFDQKKNINKKIKNNNGY